MTPDPRSLAANLNIVTRSNDHIVGFEPQPFWYRHRSCYHCTKHAHAHMAIYWPIEAWGSFLWQEGGRFLFKFDSG